MLSGVLWLRTALPTMQKSAFQQQKLAAYDTRQNVYQNGWKTTLMGSIAADCPWCFFSLFWCAPRPAREACCWSVRAALALTLLTSLRSERCELSARCRVLTPLFDAARRR